MPVVSALYAPATHTVHTAVVLAVATLPYRPAAQAVQPDVPVTSVLYAPAAHDAQSAEVEAAVVVRNMPAGHAVHAEAPEFASL